MAATPQTHDRPSSDSIDAEMPKQGIEYLDEIQAAAKPKAAMQAPPLIETLSTEDRQRLEKTLVRKIDFRLLPPVIIMYILVRTRLFEDTNVQTRILMTEIELPRQKQHRNSSSRWQSRPGS